VHRKKAFTERSPARGEFTPEEKEKLRSSLKVLEEQLRQLDLGIRDVKTIMCRVSFRMP
jgi:hypothetical protein